MMTHLPVAEKHFIERGMALTRDMAIAKQQIGRCPGSRQLATDDFVERYCPQPFAERSRLGDAARRQRSGGRGRCITRQRWLRFRRGELTIIS